MKRSSYSSELVGNLSLADEVTDAFGDDVLTRRLVTSSCSHCFASDEAPIASAAAWRSPGLELRMCMYEIFANCFVLGARLLAKRGAFHGSKHFKPCGLFSSAHWIKFASRVPLRVTAVSISISPSISPERRGAERSQQLLDIDGGKFDAIDGAACSDALTVSALSIGGGQRHHPAL